MIGSIHPVVLLVVGGLSATAYASGQPARLAELSGFQRHADSGLYEQEISGYCERSEGSSGSDHNLLMMMPRGIEIAQDPASQQWSIDGVEPDASFPVVLFWHGQGEHYGYKNASLLASLRQWADRGFIAIGADYYEGPALVAVLAYLTDGAVQIDPLDFVKLAADARCAVRWVKALASGDNPLRIDADRIAGVGFSLGNIPLQTTSLFPSGQQEFCVEDMRFTRSRWRALAQAALSSDRVDDAEAGCMRVAPADWRKVERAVGHTETLWRDIVEGPNADLITAAVSIAGTSDLMSIATDSSVVHTLIAEGGIAKLPLAMDDDGEIMSAPYKSVVDAYRDFRTDSLAQRAWQLILRELIQGIGRARPHLIERADPESVPFGSDEVVPHEVYFTPHNRHVAQTWSAVSYLDSAPRMPYLVVGSKGDATTPWPSVTNFGTILREHGYPTQTIRFDSVPSEDWMEQVLQPHRWDTARVREHRDNLIADFLLAGLTAVDRGEHPSTLALARRYFEIAALGCMSDCSASYTDEDALDFFRHRPCQSMKLENQREITKRCLDDMISSGSAPRIVVANTNALVTRPHGTDWAPVTVDPGRTFELYTGLQYQFDALSFQVAGGRGEHSNDAPHWVDTADQVAWRLLSPAGEEISGVTGRSMALSFERLPARETTVYYLEASIGDTPGQTSVAELWVAPHPHANEETGACVSSNCIDRFPGVSLERQSYFFGLIKLDMLSWTDAVQDHIPGGRVDILVNGSPIRANVRSGRRAFFHERGVRYQVCWAGTAICSREYGR